MKIAIVGTGISGLTCAYYLADSHDITVFEAGPRIGGHTATIDVDHGSKQFAIDTGFIVFNDWTYPNFIKLLDELKVPSQATEMSFSVSCLETDLEYAGTDINTLFAQRRNLLSPYFWLLLKDILRFNKQAKQDLVNHNVYESVTLGHYLKERGYSKGFAQHYLLPMGAAIWSATTDEMLEFPLAFFVRFFNNHGLLNIVNRPQWRVIQGGSRAYLDPLTKKFNHRIKVNSPVSRIVRERGGIKLKTNQGWEHFDEVILACHSDQALNILFDANNKEKRILSAIPYRENEVMLHTDTSLLPKNKRCWSSWNYLIKGNANDQRPTLTYNMNILQQLDCTDTFCVTLNQTEDIDPNKIIDSFHYAHPTYSFNSVAAQRSWLEINGIQHTWFCGAYWHNGFHEDGVVSALRVVSAINEQEYYKKTEAKTAQPSYNIKLASN